MTSEDRQLVAKALCGYLPYGLKFRQTDESTITLKGLCIEGNIITVNPKMQYGFNLVNEYGDLEYKPYLRPMSDMTEKEMSELRQWGSLCMYNDNTVQDIGVYGAIHSIPVIDWLNAHHFDYRGLIEMGLALPAPEGMYNN